MDIKDNNKIDFEDLEKVTGGAKEVSAEKTSVLNSGNCPNCTGGRLILGCSPYSAVKNYYCDKCDTYWPCVGDLWIESGKYHK